MELNYRANVRKRIPLQITVNYGLTYSGAWPVRDLSTEGVYVEMGAVDLRPGTLVEVVIRRSDRSQSAEHRLPAKVIRVESKGIALKFDQYDDNAYTDLVNLLYAH